MSLLKQFQTKPWFIKLTHWEYWSFNAIYLPICWYYLLLAIRAGNYSFFNAANPSIKYGGFLAESKWDIYPLLPKSCTPLTQIILKNDALNVVLYKADAFTFPIVCKPDTGSRGRGVAIIENLQQLQAYHHQCPVDYLLQEKVNYAMEAGIFYVRIPGAEKGMITGIVEKHFMFVMGDGRQTIEAILKQTSRYIFQVASLKKMMGDQLQRVPGKDEKVMLSPFGNHARGCLFTDSSHRINQRLSDVIDTTCKQVNGFYFGRLDIRFESWEQLELGEKFSIIELNGSGSEPTHMYDPSNSIFKAWKEIIKHWKLLFVVSKENHKKGFPYLPYSETKKMFADSNASDQLLADFQFIAS